MITIIAPWSFIPCTHTITIKSCEFVTTHAIILTATCRTGVQTTVLYCFGLDHREPEIVKD